MREIAFDTIVNTVRDLCIEANCALPCDLKQAIADSWPDSLDDSCAREEWDWMPQYDLESMTVDMLEKLRAKLNK